MFIANYEYDDVSVNDLDHLKLDSYVYKYLKINTVLKMFCCCCCNIKLSCKKVE